jgi:SAM-dependent methyltransferase
MSESEQPKQPGSESPAQGIDDLIERLRSRVAERRDSGQYPEGLEDELEQHFKRIVFHRTEPELDRVKADIQSLDSHMDFSSKPEQLESGLPGGAAMHKAVGKLVARHNQQLQVQVYEFAVAVRRAFHALGDAIQDPTTHTHGDLVGHVDAVLERLASYERSPGDSGEAVADLRRRIEELEKAEANRGFDPWFTNDAFEERFRGSKEDLMSRYEDLADEFTGCSPVVDVGCGRGEFIELLKKRDIDAKGVELDPKLASDARDLGLDVQADDGIAFLAAQVDSSLGGIAMMQVIEHLTVQQQLDVVALAHQKLRPGGRVIVETVNPQSLYVYAHSFYIDPTHTRPVHPAYLAFLFEEIGFAEVKWAWRSEPPQSDMLEVEAPQGDSVVNRNVERLNRLLFAPGDYALIVTK